MPRAPITPSVVAGPVGRVAYTGQDVAQVQPQQPGMLVQQGQQLQRLPAVVGQIGVAFQLLEDSQHQPLVDGVVLHQEDPGLRDRDT